MDFESLQFSNLLDDIAETSYATGCVPIFDGMEGFGCGCREMIWRLMRFT